MYTIFYRILNAKKPIKPGSILHEPLGKYHVPGISFCQILNAK